MHAGSANQCPASTVFIRAEISAI